MKKLVRCDPETKLLIDLDQKAIARTARMLLDAIDAEQGSCDIDMGALRDYAKQGLAGEISITRAWNDEPLRWEFREGLLPKSVLGAYGDYAFYTHGLTLDIPVVTFQNGVAYLSVEVDD